MTYYASSSGIRNLRQELEELTKKTRDLESKSQETAENCGDLWHDNPALYSLNDEADMLSRRINEMSLVLRNCERVEYPRQVLNVCLGSRVLLDFAGDRVVYDIVGYGESDPAKGRILYNSPIARIIMGKKPDETATLELANGRKTIKIIKVDPLPEN